MTAALHAYRRFLHWLLGKDKFALVRIFGGSLSLLVSNRFFPPSLTNDLFTLVLPVLLFSALLLAYIVFQLEKQENA